MTTIVLADDEALLRTALAALLPMEGDITVLAEAQDGRTAIAATLRHRPDVLVIDLEMPGVDGLGAVAEIRRERPEQVVLMLTRHARPGVLRKALKLGVQGFVSKSAEPAHITSVIATLHAGKRWIDPDVSTLAVTDDSPSPTVKPTSCGSPARATRSPTSPHACTSLRAPSATTSPTPCARPRPGPATKRPATPANTTGCRRAEVAIAAPVAFHVAMVVLVWLHERRARLSNAGRRVRHSPTTLDVRTPALIAERSLRDERADGGEPSPQGGPDVTAACSTRASGVHSKHGGVPVNQSYDAVAAWRTAGEAGDAAGAVAALSPDVTVVSPITEQFTFQGRQQVRTLLEVALAAIDDITYTDQVAEGRTVALFYEAQVGAVRLYEAQRLRLGADGLIKHITLYVRPLPALTLLMARLGPDLARRNGQPGLARLIPLASAAMHSMAATGERRIMPRVAPR